MTDPVTTHPIDTEALRKQYAHLVEKYGPEAWAESRAHVVLSLLEALAAAEHRATQAESERDEWKEVALQERGAALDLLEQIKIRDARIKEVRELHHHDVFRGHLDNGCSTCGHGWPCPTIRALDGEA